MRNRNKNIAIFILFFVMISIMTFPLLIKINVSMPGSETTDESFAVVQFFWWLKYSFLNHAPWQAEYVTAYPFNLNHPDIFIHPLWFHICRYLSIMMNEVLSYNLTILINLIASAITMFYLVYYCTKNRIASFLSGIIYAVCPYQFARLWQHFSLTFTEWMPLYLLALIKLYEYRRRKEILFAALTYVLVLLFDYHYAFFMFVTTILFVCYALFRKNVFEKGRLIKAYILACLLIIFLSLIIALPFLRQHVFVAHREVPFAWGMVKPFEDLFVQSARPLSYILPATVHPIFGRFTEGFIGTGLYGYSLTEHALYLGWIPLILAFVAIRRWRKMRKVRIVPFRDSTYHKENFYIGFFILLAIAAWLFSQPPWWNLLGFKLYTPSFFIYKALPMFRAYCRFGIVLMLAIALLAGFGLKFILDKVKSPKTKIVLTCIFTGLVLFEFWNWPPYKIIDISKVPAVYYWIKEKPGDLVIAEYPLDAGTPNVMYKFYQTRHEKKIINGTIPGTYANQVSQTIKKLSEPKTAGRLKGMGVRYALVHRDGYLETELIEEKEEVDKIPHNPGLKLVRSFSAQECPRKDIMCVQKSGPIDVYEVVAESIEISLTRQDNR